MQFGLPTKHDFIYSTEIVSFLPKYLTIKTIQYWSLCFFSKKGTYFLLQYIHSHDDYTSIIQTA